jgi:hypothetical protein
MSAYVMLSQDLYDGAKSAAPKNRFCTHEQIEFWARLGRACIENPDLPSSFVAECLLSLAESRSQKLAPFIPRSL